MPSAADRTSRDAAALERSNPAQAEKLYRQVLATSPTLATALLGLARLLIERRQDSEAAELIEQVGASGDEGAEAERLGAILWIRQQAHVMGDAPTLRARLEIDATNPQLLFELGTVLAGEGKFAEALDLLLRAGQPDRKLAAGKVRETMVKVFQIVGVRDPLADEYRAKLSSMLY